MECLQSFPQSPHACSPISMQTPQAIHEDLAAPQAPSPWMLSTMPMMQSYQSAPSPRKSRQAAESTDKDEGDASTECSSGGSTAEPPTTMMITNIPCRFGKEAIEQAIASVGFADTYDFIYIPRRKSTPKDGNIGYAFVNFLSSDDAERFATAFEGYQFQGSKSFKRCTVKVAHQQGFDALVALQNQALMQAQNQFADAAFYPCDLSSLVWTQPYCFSFCV